MPDERPLPFTVRDCRWQLVARYAPSKWAVHSKCQSASWVSGPKDATKQYQAFVEQGKGLVSPLHWVRHQLALVDDVFVASAVELAKPDNLRDVFPSPASAGGKAAV